MMQRDSYRGVSMNSSGDRDRRDSRGAGGRYHDDRGRPRDDRSNFARRNPEGGGRYGDSRQGPDRYMSGNSDRYRSGNSDRSDQYNSRDRRREYEAPRGGNGGGPARPVDAGNRDANAPAANADKDATWGGGGAAPGEATWGDAAPTQGESWDGAADEKGGAASWGDAAGAEKKDIQGNGADATEPAQNAKATDDVEGTEVKMEHGAAPGTEKDDAGEEKQEEQKEPEEPGEQGEQGSEHPKISLEDAQAMKVVELRAELEKRGMETKGLKAALIKRLVEGK